MQSALKVGNDHDLEEKRNSLLILQIKNVESMYSYTQRSICPFETILLMNELIKLQMHVFFAICMCKYCNKHDIPLSLNFRE